MKLTFDQLMSLHDGLIDKLYHRKISVATYVNEWNDIMEFSGLTLAEFADEVDLRWDVQKMASSTLFRS